jgi:hypothetical protein
VQASTVIRPRKWKFRIEEFEGKNPFVRLFKEEKKLSWPSIQGKPYQRKRKENNHERKDLHVLESIRNCCNCPFPKESTPPQIPKRPKREKPHRTGVRCLYSKLLVVRLYPR